MTSNQFSYSSAHSNPKFTDPRHRSPSPSSPLPFPLPLYHPSPPLPQSKQPTQLSLLLLAAASLTSPPTVSLLHIVELPRVAVVLALASPRKAATTAVPACAALLELEAAGGRGGLVGGWGGEGAGCGGGGEEEDVELHVGGLVFFKEDVRFCWVGSCL